MANSTATTPVSLIVGHIAKTPVQRVNKTSNEIFYSCRILENDKNGEVRGYNFCVRSQKLAQYLTIGRYVAVAGYVKERENNGYVNFDIAGAQVRLLNQVKREEVMTDSEIASIAARPEPEIVEDVNEDVPF